MDGLMLMGAGPKKKNNKKKKNTNKNKEIPQISNGDPHHDRDDQEEEPETPTQPVGCMRFCASTLTETDMTTSEHAQ